MTDVSEPVPLPLVSKSALSLLGRLAVFGAGLGGLTALGLMLKYLSQSLDGPHNLDLITLLFQAFLVILPLTPFLAVGAAAAKLRATPMLVGCLIFELLALASCWYYAQLAFRLVKPDALEALTLLFLPVYQFAALGVCLGLAAAWHRWCGRP